MRIYRCRVAASAGEKFHTAERNGGKIVLKPTGDYYDKLEIFGSLDR